MSYYPHNQPMHATEGDLGEGCNGSIARRSGSGSASGSGGDGTQSMDLPRRSSNSNTLTVGATTVVGGEDSPVKEGMGSSKGNSPVVEVHPPQQQYHDQQQQQQQQQYHQQYQQQQHDQQQQQQPPSPMPSQPERAFVRARPSGDGSASLHGGYGQAQGQMSVPPPRMSSGSARSGHSMHSAHSARSAGTGVAV